MIFRKTDEGDILTIIDHQYGSEIETLWATCKIEDNIEKPEGLTKVLQLFR